MTKIFSSNLALPGWPKFYFSKPRGAKTDRLPDFENLSSQESRSPNNPPKMQENLQGEIMARFYFHGKLPIVEWGVSLMGRGWNFKSITAQIFFCGVVQLLNWEEKRRRMNDILTPIICPPPQLAHWTPGQDRLILARLWNGQAHNLFLWWPDQNSPFGKYLPIFGSHLSKRALLVV